MRAIRTVFPSALLVLVLTSCGGGGSSDPVAPSCGPNFATPNYNAATDPSTSTANEIHWWARFPLRVFFKNDIPHTTGDSAKAQAWTAFQRWNVPALTPLVEEVTTEAAANVIVEFKRTVASDVVLGLTLTTVNTRTNEAVKSEMTINIRDGMTDNQFFRGLLATSSHELGHTLFLGGHSPFNTDLMYPYGNPSTDTALSTRDGNSLITAYCGSFSNRSVREAALPTDTYTIKQFSLRFDGQCTHDHH